MYNNHLDELKTSMNELQNQSLPFENIGSLEVTEKIKKVARASNFKSLGEAPDRKLLEEAGVNEVMAIKNSGKTFLLNKESRQAVAGTYLVDMDSLLSLNGIQRIPGKKLAISLMARLLQLMKGM